MRERDVESYLTKKLDSIGLSCLKFIPDDRTGMPDRVILLPGGRVLWCELKTKGGSLSEIQKYRHLELSKSGHEVVTVWDIPQADALVERLRDEVCSSHALSASAYEPT